MSSNTICTENKENTMTFNTYSEYIDYVIKISKRQQQEEQEERQKAYFELVESIIRLGADYGVSYGIELEKAISSKDHKIITEEERKDLHSAITGDATKQAMEMFREIHKLQKTKEFDL